MRATWFKVLLLAGLCFPAHIACAQDLKTTLNAAREAYNHHRSLSFNISYSYFEDKTSKSPFKTTTGTVKLDNQRYRVMLDGVQTLRNESLYIITNNTRKVLMLDSAIAAGGNQFALINIDTLLRIMPNMKYVETDSRHNAIRIDYDNDELDITSTELYFSKETGLIDRIIVQYRTVTDGNRKLSPRMVVNYSNMNTAPVFTADEFSASRYVQLNAKGIYMPASAYKAYSFINHLEE